MQILKDDVKNRIFEAAIMEFKEKGFEKASMRSIAQKAGVTVGNVYRYFENKEDIFYAVISPAYNIVISTIRDNTGDGAIYFNYEENIMNDLTNLITDIFVVHRTALFILLDGSEGSKYSSTKKEVVALVENIIRNKWFINIKNEMVIKDEHFASVIATSFVEGFLVILREYSDRNEMRQAIKQYIEFYFKYFVD